MTPPSGVRVLPVLTPDTEFFWTSGRDGRLRFLECADCEYFIHPPAPVCPRCGERNVAPKAVSGDGHVFAVTVNQHPWTSELVEPYAIVLVELVEQQGLRLTSNVTGCLPEQITPGMPVRVHFEDHDPVFLPLFAPRGD